MQGPSKVRGFGPALFFMIDLASGESPMVKHEPEVRRANAKRYVDACNWKVHEAPWTTGRTKGLGAGGLYEALELAALAYKTHRLPYDDDLSKMLVYSPRRFRWIYDEKGSADHCVKLLDTETHKVVVWPHWAG
jgi:hypothetical protein